MNNTFGKPIIPKNEKQRLKALKEYADLNGLPDIYFNAIAVTIAKTFNAPIALVSLVASEHVEFKGNYGMEGVYTVDRGLSLCSLAILDPDPTIFPDARKEPCLLNNPLVAGEFGLQFYAGVPLTTKEGYNIGTVCIVDKEPREFSEKDTALLSKFSKSIISELENRKILKEKV
ncbi:MAG: GAF domain-containing protein [Bacteroidota bacterium]